MDEEDPAAVIVAALQEATAAARAAAVAAEASRVAVLETQNRITQEVSDLVKKVDGFEHSLQVMSIPPGKTAGQAGRLRLVVGERDHFLPSAATARARASASTVAGSKEPPIHVRVSAWCSWSGLAIASMKSR